MPSRFALACLIAAAMPLAAQQATGNPQELYQQVRARVLESVARAIIFTCVQTVTRKVYTPASTNPRRCDQIIAEREARPDSLTLESWDRLRLDVGIADQHEVYSWVGASRFEEAGITELVGGGQTSSGEFASTLYSIFLDHPSMRYVGEKQIGGRRVLEYSYQTPLEMSRYQIRIGSGGQFTTAYAGSVFVDPEARDVVRVTSRTAELVQSIGYCQMLRELDYGRVRIGSADALLPREARAVAVEREGGERLNVNSYSNCREYAGESVLRFDDADAGASVATPGPANRMGDRAEIPSGLMFECRILTPLDSDSAAAGDPIEALLRSAIRDSTGRTIAPRGARLRGRLTQFTGRPATATGKAAFDIGIQWHTIELGGAQVPFAANLAKVHAGGATENNLRTGVGVATLYERELHLKQLDATWITAKPSP